MAVSRTCKVVMGAFAVLLIVALTTGLVIGLGGKEADSEKTFSIDYEENVFLLDGQPFHYVAGSFHYFRALPGAWRSRLRQMRASGLNTVDTYVEWSLHNPFDGVYNWKDIANLEQFIEIAHEEDLYVILRPGPYICAERDNGGLPHWLFTKYPNIQLRTSDVNYTKEVSLWYAELMPRMKKYLYGNGGPIIMVQVENEYGVFHACDNNYLNWLRDETELHVQGHALLFTTDIPNERISCGKIDGVFATTDFGIDRIHEIDEIWKILRTVQPTGPLVNSEFYPGWLTHWQEENQRRDPHVVAAALDTILSYGASVNIYMFFGGTNFGFTAGANDWGYGNYTADITSYDYDAVMDEAGDTTIKYDLVRNVISKYLDPPKILPSEKSVKMAYGRLELKPIATLLSAGGRKIFTVGSTVVAEKPKSFEELNQYSGLVLYETILPELEIDPTVLSVENLQDRALAFVDQYWIGTLSRENRVNAISLGKGLGTKLQLLVENQGRINFNVANDTKGLLGAVSIQKLSGEKLALSNWNSTSFPLDGTQVETLINEYKSGQLVPNQDVVPHTNRLTHGPTVYFGELMVSAIGDSYLDTEGWGKGVAYINGLNLGRYWPLAGPQLTMYVPKEALHLGLNQVVLIEYQKVPEVLSTGNSAVYFEAAARLDGV